MSNRALTWAFAQPLKSGPKFVLVVLADLADEDDSCFPGVPMIAQRVGSVESAVRENLDKLLAAGLISEERRHRQNGSRTSNRYRLAVKGPLDLTPESGGTSGAGLAPESEVPSAGIRGGQAPESGGPPEPLEVNPQNEPTVSTVAVVTPGAEKAQELCEALARLIVENGSKRPTVTKAWLDAARLLVDRDGRSVAQVHRMIEWCQADSFWRSNIQSMPKLRDRYDQMRLQALRDTGTSSVIEQGRAAYAQAVEMERQQA